MIRRIGEPPQRGVRYTRRIGVYAILPRAGKLLLTYQDEPHDEIQLPGGGVDPGESPIHALHREVFEETGWRIANPRKIGVFRRFVYMPEYAMHAEKLCHIYLARPVRPHGPPSEPGHLPLWLDPLDAMAKLYNDGDADFVAAIAAA